MEILNLNGNSTSSQAQKETAITFFQEKVSRACLCKTHKHNAKMLLVMVWV